MLLLLVTNGDLDRELVGEGIGSPAPVAVVIEVGRVSVSLLLLMHFLAPLSRREPTLLLANLVEVCSLLRRERCWIVGK